MELLTAPRYVLAAAFSVALLVTGGCGSSVMYEQVVPEHVAWTDHEPAPVAANPDARVDTATEYVAEPDAWDAAEPDVVEQWEDTDAALPDPIADDLSEDAFPEPEPQETSGPQPHDVPEQEPTPIPDPGVSGRGSQASACDWYAELERAMTGREARWIVRDTGAWGRAQVPGDKIWIAPRTPCEKVYSVAVHEWTHHMQGVVYRDWAVVERELAPYGGPEINADCGALILGATWIHYGCPTERARAAAAAILQGERP